MFMKNESAKDYVNGLFNLEGHIGIVTGASRGIGFGIANSRLTV
jgi:hypothetical protein